ncbi:tetratricopeptide repeat protein 37 [Scaptodrosophila lebanonensis]|uniref:Tetratricopeptide repeat protein 37 n=1 Tax=Drosophila lebanonensis TaxID=7225 RepID=A0A6J2TDM6_DROLE|nr:tetratricopeptide repeat protein 37 [Scaptodrosophila lebanonensis]
MSAKALVKDIRESIKSGSYEDAIKKCQSLLNVDKKMGYLLLGAAYQNVDKIEATKHLRKSIEHTDGSPIVALQGLATCAPSTELPEILDQLLDLVPEKSEDYYDRLFALAADVSAAPLCFGVLKKRAQNVSDPNHTLALQYLGKIWVSNDFEATTTEGELYKAAMEKLLAVSDGDHQILIYKRYLKWLYKEQDYVSCIRNACNMTISHPKHVYAYEWICKIYCETHWQLDNEAWQLELKQPIQSYAEILINLNENSNLGLLTKAFHMYGQDQFLGARQLALQAQKSHPTYKVTLELLARIHMQLGAYKMALLLWQELGQVHEEYAECLSYETDATKLKEAVNLLENSERTVKNVKCLARCYAKLSQMQLLQTLSLDELSKVEYFLSPTEALQKLAAGESFEELLLCGELHFKLGQYADALKCMLKATRLRPHFSKCFDYLGRLYQSNGDLNRARKCFEKCINLNPLAEQAVDALSSIYQELGEEDLNETLLQNTLRYLKSDDAVRLQYKLGLHFLQVKKWDDAIQCFRIAIKHDFKCMVYWESLGDAYASRGSYNSAIRVFEKILMLSPTNCYAQLQVGIVKTTIRMYPEAIADFNTLLQRNPNYLPGLKGIAEAHIGLAQNLKGQNLYGRAKLNYQLAVNHLQSAFLQPKAHQMVWLWRLMANAFVQTAQLPLSLANLDVDGSLAKRNEAITFLSREELLVLAQRFYLCCLKLKQNTFLWYELAMCSYLSAVYIPEKAAVYLETAAKVCKMAIKACTNRWQNWNLLGVINMHSANENLALAQHCFIKAVTVERKSFTSWTNLGVLYLKLRDIRLANEAFNRAQQASPIYPNAWIGQAMVAETIGEHEEAFDLFRHCQQFEYHPEAALGYAHWVCEVLSDPVLRNKPHNKHAIRHMYADICALDAINWYIQNEEGDANVASLTLQGFLYARQKMYQKAITAFARACKLAEPGADRDKLYTNLGYLYLKLGQPEQAVMALNTVANATFKPIIGLALAYYRSGQLQESYSIYNSVLNSVAGQDDEKASTILVAMASMVYAFQGQADTKTLLYQCILLKGVAIQALFSACALGVLHCDYELIETIMSEFVAYEYNEVYCADVSYLTAHYRLVREGLCEAVNYLQKRVRMFPQSAALRKVFAKFLLDYCFENRKYHLATSNMALTALKLGHLCLKKGVTAKEEAEINLYACRALLSINRNQSLELIQRTIRLDPRNKLAREILSSIC